MPMTKNRIESSQNVDVVDDGPGPFTQFEKWVATTHKAEPSNEFGSAPEGESARKSPQPRDSEKKQGSPQVELAQMPDKAGT